MRRLSIIAMICVVALEIQMGAAEAAMSSKDMLSKADEARGNREGVQWQVEIVSKENGRKSSQTLRVKARYFNVVAETLAPAKFKGHKLVILDRNMWFMRPGLRKPVPVSPRQRLLGGAANGDIASTNYAEDYDVVSMSEEPVNGELCYLFDLKAIDTHTTYDRIKYWIAKERLVGVRAEFFTVSGRMLKSATFTYDNRVQLQGKAQPFVSQMVITDGVMPENVTTMTYSQADLAKIPNAAFNLNLLLD